MWVVVRWCREAWGKMIGQSCWRECSCSHLLREAPDRPQPARVKRGRAEAEQRVTHDTETALLGMNQT